MKSIIVLSLLLLPLQMRGQSISGAWSAASSDGFLPRSGHNSQTIGDKIYIFGGADTSFQATSGAVDVYDPVSNSWSTLSTTGSFTPRYDFASGFVDGKIYIIGGSDGKKFINDVDALDVKTQTWSIIQTTGDFTNRAGLSASVFDGKIYVYGGINDLSGNLITLNNLEVFDPTTNHWSTPSTIGAHSPRRYFTSQVVGGKIFMIGGRNRLEFLSDIDIFDPSTNSWFSPATSGLFLPRAGLSSSVLDQKIYVLGGDSGSVGNIIFNTFEIFDPSSNQWSSPVTTGNFTARHSFSSNIVNGKIFTIGGTISSSSIESIVNINEVFTPVLERTNDFDDRQLTGVSVSPNPTDGDIKIHNAPQSLQRVSIMNVLGETVNEIKNPGAADFTLDLSKLSPGTYFARFATAGEVVTRKIIKE